MAFGAPTDAAVMRPSGVSLASWSATVDAARALRQQWRASLKGLPPWSWTLGVGVGAAILFGPGSLMLGGAALAAEIRGRPLEDFSGAGQVARPLILGAFVTAVAVYIFTRRAAARARLRQMADALGGRVVTGRSAERRFLDWLDEHNWGPAPLLVGIGRAMPRMVVEGGVRGSPVLVSMAIPSLLVPARLSAALSERPDYSPFAEALAKVSAEIEPVNVFVALPSAHERTLSADAAERIASAGFAAELARDGLRLSCNDTAERPFSPDALLALFGQVLDDRSFVPVP